MTPKTRFWLKSLGWAAATISVLAIAAGVTAAVVHSRYVERAAKFDLTKIDEVAERSAVYDGNGEFYSFFGGENRLVVPLAKVSKHFINALIAREDSRFWEHGGVDSKGVLRALIINLRAGETKQGGSTITQQLARNACGLGERSLDRKALEAVLAGRIEKQYTKEQILEFYVNRIYFGGGFHGIETAARGYFGKAAADLTLGESATLAALIRNPKRLSPTRDMGAALEQRDVVLTSMAELKLISAEERAAAQAQELKLTERNAVRVTDDAIMDAVLQELSTLLAVETLEHGGLKVYMTIDPQLQAAAQAAADRRLTEIEAQKGFPHPKKADFVPETGSDKEKPTDYLQAAVVIVDNRTGAVRAAVGARDYAQSKYSRALVSRRQVGSTFKPFVFAAAFERGLLPGTAIDDSRIAAGEYANLPKKWSPENSDGEYGGLQPAAIGLLKSRNTMSVRVGEMAGMTKVRQIGQSAGLGDDIPNLPVTYLGAFESTVRDLTAAYTVFPNGGIYRAPYVISRVEDREGQILWTAPLTEKRVMAPETAWMVSSILHEVMKTGTASKAKSLGWKKHGAGKTGTTNDFFDAWFVGYTSSLTCGVWVGMDQPTTIMEKGYGSTLALPVWVDIMQQVSEKSYPAAPFKAGMPLAKVALCSISGGRATSTCIAQRCGYETELPATRLPSEICRTHPEPAPLPVAVAPAPIAPPPVPQSVPAPAPSSAPVAVSVPVPANEVRSTAAPVPNSRSAIDIIDSSSTGPVSGGARAGAVPIAEARSQGRVPVDRAPTAQDPRFAPQRVIAPGRQRDAIPREALVGENALMPPPARPVARPVPVAEGSPPPAPRRVEVRRAVPVEPATAPPRPVSGPVTEVVPAAPPGTTVTETTLPDGSTEKKQVEKTADGRVRVTTTRTVRVPSKKAQPVKRPEAGERDKDDD